MQLFYWPSPHGNFGDDLNDWFWDDVLPGWREWDDSVSLIGIGSLMTKNLKLLGGRKVVVGAGSGYGQPPELGPDWDVRFVRGPRTAAALGLPASAGITDTAALCARLPRFAGLAGSGRRPLLVPHWMSDLHPTYDWPRTAAAAGVDYVSPRGDAAAVIGAIAAAPLVLAESLHAAVIADAFRVPWRAVRSELGSFNLFKWRDWTDSLEVPFEVTDLFAPLTRLRGLLPRSLQGREERAPLEPGTRRSDERPAAPRRTLRRRLMARMRVEVGARMIARALRQPAFLSAEPVLNDRLDRIEAALRGLARDYGGA